MIWLRAFESAARNGSFSAAAHDLNLTPAAISQQIKLLEHHLGVQLFVRLPRGVALTDAGHAYAQPICKSFADIQDATTSLFGRRRKRTVRVRASISYAALVLAPKLRAFREAYPDIDIRVTTAIWTDRIEDEAIDLEIRYGYGDWAERNIRHLGHGYAAVVCAPAVAACFGGDQGMTSLATQAIQIIGSETDWSQMAEQFGIQWPVFEGLMKVDSSLIALQIMSGGTGAAIVSEELSKRYIEQGLLVSPLDHRLPMPRSYFLIIQDGAQERSEVTRFCDWLSEH